MIGDPINLYDFEFEQFSIKKDILRELILDEVIMANSKEARQINSQLRDKYKSGVLELIYERKDKEKKATQPSKTLTVLTGVDNSYKGKEDVVMGDASNSTADESPNKQDVDIQSPEDMALPNTFKIAKGPVQFV